jgi:heme-degrading monooxygenase HmoA
VNAREEIILINVFSVQPDKQDELLRLLAEMTDEVTRHLPGFRSAEFHKSLDGRHVANYARWDSQDSWRAMVRHPEVLHRMEAILRIATFQPALYVPASSHGAP